MRRRLAAVLIVLVVLLGGTYVFVRATLASDFVRSTLEQQLAARLGQPVRVGSAGASLVPRITIDLNDVSIGSPPPMHLETIHIGVGLRGLLSRTITDADIVVTGGRIRLPLAFPLLPPSPAAEPADAAGGITVESVRVIAVRDFVLEGGGGRTIRLDLHASLDGDQLHVSELTARAERTELRAAGTVNSLARLEGQFEASAGSLDLDEIVALGSAFTSPTEGAEPASGSTVPLHFAVKLTAAAGEFAGYGFNELTTTVDIAPGRIALSPLGLRLFGGSFQGSVHVDSRSGGPRLRIDGQLAGLNAAELLKASDSPGGITGTLHGGVSLTGAGTDAGSLVRTSRGTITAAITDGTMPHLEMVRAIVLAFGKPSGAPPEGSGSAFSRLGGTFRLERGTLTSNDLSMTSRDFDLTGGGSLTIETGAVAAQTDVVLSNELTAQAGTDLRRHAQQDGRVIVPARISGTLQAPAITLDVVAATRRAITNELKRRATDLLEGLFKKKRD